MSRSTSLAVLRLAAFLSVTTAWGCADNSDHHAAEDDRSSAGELRIVSFSPAISRTLIDLKLEGDIVGRSAFCDFLDPAIPVVGDLEYVNYERLIELQPSHVLVQAPAMGVDPQLAELVEASGWRLVQLSELNTIDDIERMVRELPSMLCKPRTAKLTELTARSAELLNEIAAALSPGPRAERSWTGPTLLVYQLEPVVSVFGRGTYLDDVLLRLGAVNAVGIEGWRELTLEDVARLNPPAVILIQPASNSPDPAEAMRSLGRLKIDAVRDNRVAVLVHPDALRPCSAVADVAREMRRLLRTLKTEGEQAR